MEAGIRELRDNLSRYLREVEAGQRIAVTAHGRVVAEIVPPRHASSVSRSRLDAGVLSGDVRPPVAAGDTFADWPDIRLPAGTARVLIDDDRGDA